jgi:hypothetical protein
VSVWVKLIQADHRVNVETVEGPVVETDRTSALILWVGSATFPGGEDSLSISAREPDVFVDIYGPLLLPVWFLLGRIESLNGVFSFKVEGSRSVAVEV